MISDNEFKKQTENLKSNLPTFQQYKFISNWLSNNETIDITDSKNYGNYSNINFTFTGYYSDNYGKTYQYSENKNKKSENILLSTGASERNKTNNIYEIKKLTKDETRYCNALFLDRINTILGFSSLNKAVGSIIKYKKLNAYPYVPRVDYGPLYKTINERYQGSLG